MIIHKESNLNYCEFVQEVGYDPTTTDWWKNKEQQRRSGILEIYLEMQKENPQSELLEAVIQFDRNVSGWTTTEKQLDELGFVITNPTELRDEDLRASFDCFVEFLYAFGVTVVIENGDSMPLIFGKPVSIDTVVPSSSGRRVEGVPVSNDVFSKFSTDIRRYIIENVYGAMTNDSIPDQVSCTVFGSPEENFIGAKAEDIGKFHEFIVVNIEKMNAIESGTQLFSK